MRYKYLLVISNLIVVVATHASEKAYSTGELSITSLNYEYINSEKVSGNARYYHGISALIKSYKDIKTLGGDGVTVAMWDKGLVQNTHADFFDGQITFGSAEETLLGNHATQVAGIIAGNGNGLPSAQGMAKKTKLISFDYSGDIISEMTKLNALHENRIQISNHSYGIPVGWSDICETEVAGKRKINWIWSGPREKAEDPDFGKYNNNSHRHDKFAVDNPYWTQVVAAGNSRSPILSPSTAEEQVPSMNKYKNIINTHVLKHDGTSYLDKSCKTPLMEQHKSNLYVGGYDTLPGDIAVSKNVITVGAMRDPQLRIDPKTNRPKKITKSDVVSTDFSSWGCADDSRVKPDIIANGDSLISTAIPERCSIESCKSTDVTSSESSYVQMSGTSQAAPVVTGALALLNEMSFIERKGQFLRSDEAKAVLIHTALNANEGPDCEVGWGVIQADQAANTIRGLEPANQLVTISIKSGESLEFALIPQSGRPGRVTVVWLDQAGIPVDGLNNDSKMLIDDIDIVLNDNHGNVIYPWSINKEIVDGDVNFKAIRAVNNVDNIERIDVPDEQFEAKSEWILKISADKFQSRETLTFAMVLWGFIK